MSQKHELNVPHVPAQVPVKIKRESYTHSDISRQAFLSDQVDLRDLEVYFYSLLL